MAGAWRAEARRPLNVRMIVLTTNLGIKVSRGAAAFSRYEVIRASPINASDPFVAVGCRNCGAKGANA